MTQLNQLGPLQAAASEPQSRNTGLSAPGPGGGYIRVYDLTTPEEIVTYLYENGICVTEIKTDKIGLEEYYIDLMKGGK